MTPERWRVVREVFDAARGAAPVDRGALLDARCADDSELRREVESLLSHHGELGAFLETPAVDAGGAIDGERERLDDQRVGPYRLIRMLGSGGMGVVYLAEQDNPRRRVAIKLLRAGVVSPASVKRFQQESQVLARLQHSGIALIIEAGAARAGQPFFAMEYIDGLPLNAHVEKNALSTRERLILFNRICDAVQHAHQKGVVHRDLKPGNILVVAKPDEGGESRIGRPKILDFGIARATDCDVQMSTIHTHVGQLIGTVPYMSPEQLAGDPLNIDTRADVYALGVILFELLTGRLPHDVLHRSLPEAVRLVNERDATHLSSIDRNLRGDLDTIVAKALEKDRERRYQSASELSTDIERYLHDQPIQARPATTFYQLRKFAKRNKALVGGAICVFVVLSCGVVGTTWQAVVATRAEREAKQSAARFESLYRFFVGMLSSPDMSEAGATTGPASPLAPGRRVTLAAMLDRGAASVPDRLRGQENVQAVVRHTLGKAYYSLRLFDEAEVQWRAALESYQRLVGPDDPATLTVAANLGLLYRALGRLPEAEAIVRSTLAAQTRRLGAAHPDTFVSMADLVGVLESAGKQRDADAAAHDALPFGRAALAADGRAAVVDSANTIGMYLLERERFADALPLYALLVETVRAAGTPVGEVSLGDAEFRYGACLEHARRFEEARTHLEAALSAYESSGAEKTKRDDALEGLACMYDAWKQPAKAAEYRARLAKASSRPAGGD